MIQVFYFRDFTVPIASFEEAATLVTFDQDCNTIVATIGNQVKVLTNPTK
jgi:hypothetical protein